MKRLMILYAASTCLLLGGCLAGRPTPPEFRLWEKEGVDGSGVKIALLECGANNPSGDTTQFPYPAGKELEYHALVERCMQEAGFNFRSSVLVCKSFHNIDACKDNAVVPVRDKNKRLNSSYCKHYVYSTYPECRP